jgi:hypothetical protein
LLGGSAEVLANSQARFEFPDGGYVPNHQEVSSRRQVSSRARRKLITSPQTSRKDWKMAAEETLGEAKLTFAPIDSRAYNAVARAGEGTCSTATGNGTTCSITYAVRKATVHRTMGPGGGNLSSRKRPRLDTIASRPSIRRYSYRQARVTPRRNFVDQVLAQNGHLLFRGVTLALVVHESSPS